jgi:hypothetical protein
MMLRKSALGLAAIIAVLTTAAVLDGASAQLSIRGGGTTVELTDFIIDPGRSTLRNRTVGDRIKGSRRSIGRLNGRMGRRR